VLSYALILLSPVFKEKSTRRGGKLGVFFMPFLYYVLWAQEEQGKGLKRKRKGGRNMRIQLP